MTSPHLLLEGVNVEGFGEWQLVEVRKQMQECFRESVEDLCRFKYLTYVWLSITEQLGEIKAMKASTDLKSIYSHGFTFWYATKYLAKKEQKA